MFRNTRQLGFAPEPSDSYAALESDSSRARVLFVLNGEEFNRALNYPVIVEGWDKRKHGRVRRAWEAAFTQAERVKVGRYYGRFYRWYFVSGTPKRVSFKIQTVLLLQRAAAFFAGV